MRILYFYQYFTLPQGSYSTRAYEFARRWVEAGAEVTVVTCRYDKSGLETHGLVSRHKIEGINVVCFNLRLSQSHSKLTRVITYFAYSLGSCWTALFAPADVVLCSSGPLTVGIPGMVSRLFRRRPFIFEVRDLWPDGAVELGLLRNPVTKWLAYGLARACYRRAHMIVPLSVGMADWIRDRYGCDRLTVIPNASDVEFAAGIAPLSNLPKWALGKRIVVYTGTMGRVDNTMQLAALARELFERNDSTIHIVVIGDGSERQNVEIAASGLSNISFLGLLPKVKVFEWLKVASCALYTVSPEPALANGSPNKMFDALASGVPVVQTSRGWIAEMLEERDCGLSANPTLPMEFADRVQQICHNNILRDKLAANALCTAKECFDRSLLSSQLLSVLSSACNKQIPCVDESAFKKNAD